jgi:hypothetical protein
MKSKKKFPVFWVFLGVYTIVLVLLGASFLSYTDKCLLAYENAQPDRIVQSYIDDFKVDLIDGVLPEGMEFSSVAEPFESNEDCRVAYLERLKGVSEFTYVKDNDSYLTEEPIYDILGDGELVAKVTWTATNPRTIFGILTIMDWSLLSEVAWMDDVTSDYNISVPEDYSVSVNGITLSQMYLTDYDADYEALDNVMDYVDIPKIARYNVCGLINEPEIVICDGRGDEVDFELDGENTVEIGYYHSDTVPDEYADEALKMAKVWDNFLTNDLSGELHGLATVRKYLVRDSYYWNIATDYAKSVDITFVSSHSLPTNCYENVSLTDFTRYSDECYSCHIYFDKRMILGSGKSIVNTIDSTFYFVYCDDSDDGVDNPHWAIVDMM